MAAQRSPVSAAGWSALTGTACSIKETKQEILKELRSGQSSKAEMTSLQPTGMQLLKQAIKEKSYNCADEWELHAGPLRW